MKMNIQKALKEVHKGGGSEQAIADELGCSQPTVHRIINGQEPKYYLGKAIEVMHAKFKRKRK